jgi:sodium--glutamate symport carrier gltS
LPKLDTPGDADGGGPCSSARTPDSRILRTYTIPEPVVGVPLVALLVPALRSTLAVEVHVDTKIHAPLMLTFFATIGHNVDLAGLRTDGKALIVFLGVVVLRSRSGRLSR